MLDRLFDAAPNPCELLALQACVRVALATHRYTSLPSPTRERTGEADLPTLSASEGETDAAT